MGERIVEITKVGDKDGYGNLTFWIIGKDDPEKIGNKREHLGKYIVEKRQVKLVDKSFKRTDGVMVEYIADVIPMEEELQGDYAEATKEPPKEEKIAGA